MTKMNDNKVWLITGASKGLGKNLVESVLERGDCVVATSRSRAGLTASLGLETDYFLPVVVNLSDPESIQSAVNQAQQKFGRIDVLVNNAGYGQFGAVEELTDAEVRGNFEVNVFGLLNMVRGVLPLMREKKSGHVLNISSIGGILGEYPGVGVYCATKFAVAGLTEGLYSDLKPLGIRVSVVYPGYFRTDFLSSESVAAPRQPIPDYVESKKVVDAHLNTINQN
ncbi:MAG: SDR family oxidoreductase, partial [Proteobacteria bacterium]